MDAVEYAVKKYAGKRAIFGSLPGPKMPYLARGIDGYTLDLYRRPVLAKQFMDMATRYNVGIAKLMIDLGVDALAMGGDLAYRDGPLMTVEHFREVYAPHIKCVVEVAHKRGIPLIKHSDGNLNPILRDLIETGIDGIHSIEPIAGMDLGRVKAEYGDRICLMGNVDCTYTLTTKPVESVQAKVKECMDAAAAGGGYILSSSNCFHKACRIDNIIAMINAGRRYGIYPRSGGRG
jgi:uroporphyrinogen decarboxylase